MTFAAPPEGAAPSQWLWVPTALLSLKLLLFCLSPLTTMLLLLLFTSSALSTKGGQEKTA